MATAISAVDGGVSGTSTVNGAGVSPAGPNPLMLVVTTGRAFASVVRAGGSGGTDLTKVSSDYELWKFVVDGKGNVWRLLPGPIGSSAGYVLFGGASDSSAASMVYVSGADQTTPYTTPQTNYGENNAPSLAMVGLAPLQPVLVGLMVGHLPDALTGLIANGATTVLITNAGPVPGAERQSMTLWLAGTAGVDGTVTIGGTLTPNFSVGAWEMWGIGLNAAAGSTIRINPLSGRGGAAAQPLVV